MRDAFGEIDPDEVDIIDFIEPDAAAFGQEGAVEQPVEPRHRPRWLIPTAAASVVALAGGAFIWSPWDDDEATAFRDNAAPPLTLTDELIFGDAPAELTLAFLGEQTDDGDLFNLGDAVGYFFAEEGAEWNFTDADADGTWAAFFSVSEDFADVVRMDITDGETTTTVQGSPAIISTEADNVREIRFGPVDGRLFTVVTNGMSQADTLAFAEAVGVEDSVPTIAGNDVLGDMQPVGDMDDYETAIGTMFAALSPFGEQPGTVSLHYGEISFDFEDEQTPQYSLASQPTASDTTLAMLRFMVGGQAGPLVHNQPTIVADEVTLGFGANRQAASLVAWIEGGRLIVVAGPHAIEATVVLAETVRPATVDEWADVVTVANNSVDPSIPLFPDEDVVVEPTGETVYQHVDQQNGDTTSVTLEFVDGQLTTCIEDFSQGGGSGWCNSFLLELPILTTRTSDDSSKQFVIAIVDRGIGDVASELRITLADGSIETYPLQDLWAELPGPAVATLLPDHHGPVELWIGAKLVKTLPV